MRIIINIILSAMLVLSFTQAESQVQATIKQTGVNTVTVYVKSPTAYNTQIGNLTFAVSIPDQTLSSGTNPTDAEITKTILMNNMYFETAGITNPYIIDGRAIYTYNLLPLSSTDAATNWPANTDNAILDMTFPTNTYFVNMRLEDLLNQGGGSTNTMYLYVQLNGVGDATNYTTTYYGNGASNGGSVQFAPLELLPSPVKFLSFSATRKADAALLTWQIENESANAAYYDVERSVNGVDFSKVVSVPAKNNGNTSNSYEIADNNLTSIRTNGVIYYRVKQVDLDGKSVYTPVKSIRLTGKETIMNVYPNPVKTSTNVTFDLSEDQNILIYLTDATGKEIRKIQTLGTKGFNSQKIEMSNLSSGSYMLKLQTANDIKSISVIKAN